MFRFSVIFLLFLQVLSIDNNPCCILISQRICGSCPRDMHLFKGNCLFDITYCSEYDQGIQCKKCEVGYKLNNEKNECLEEKTLRKIDIQKNESGDYWIVYELMKNYKMDMERYKTVSGEKEITNQIIRLYVEYQIGEKQFERVNFKIEGKEWKIEEWKKIQNLKYEQEAYQVSRINLFDSKKQSMLKDLDRIVRQNRNALKAIKQVKQKKYKDHQQYQLEYESKEGNYMVYIDDEGGFYYLKSILFFPFTSDLSLLVKEQDQNLDHDEFYQMVKSFIQEQNRNYAGLIPLTVEIVFRNQIRVYQLRFQLKDGSLWDVQVKVDTKKLQFFYEGENQVIQSKANESHFKILQIQTIFKDFHFLIVRDEISKKYEGKFKEYILYQVRKSENQNIFTYEITFQKQTLLERVTAEIGSKDFIVKINNLEVLSPHSSNSLLILHEKVESITGIQDFEELPVALAMKLYHREIGLALEKLETGSNLVFTAERQIKKIKTILMMFVQKKEVFEILVSKHVDSHHILNVQVRKI